MTTVSDFYNAIDRFAPFATAEDWDNVGLLIGDANRPVCHALLALDLTGSVLEEARRLGAELVITHHPVIFKPLRTLESSGIPYRAAEAGLSVICAHTNLDLAEGGVNDALAARLNLQNIRPFVPESSRPWRQIVVFVPAEHAQTVYEAMSEAGAGKDGNYTHCAFFARGEGRFLPLAGANPAIGEVGRAERVEEVRIEMLCPPHAVSAVVAAMQAAHPYEQPAFQIYENYARTDSLSLGRLGEVECPFSPAAFAAFVRERLGAAGLRYLAGTEEIHTAAVCSGNGGNLLRKARNAGAQALITGETKHDQIVEAAELGLTLIDAGHFATEHVVLEPLRQRLAQSIPEVKISLSQNGTDGMVYLGSNKTT